MLTTRGQVVITPVRNPQHETARALSDLPRGEGSRLIVPATPYDARSEQAALEVVKELKEEHGIARLDIVLANAGGGLVYPSVKEVKRSEIHEHMELNVYSVVSLYQATRDLLGGSPGPAQFAIMGSSAGSLGYVERLFPCPRTESWANIVSV